MALLAATEAYYCPAAHMQIHQKAVQDEIESVQKEIEGVGGEIVHVEVEVQEAKSGGAKEEVAALQSKKQQLRSEELQLWTEKKNRLRAKQLMLLRAAAGLNKSS